MKGNLDPDSQWPPGNGEMSTTYKTVGMHGGQE